MPKFFSRLVAGEIGELAPRRTGFWRDQELVAFDSSSGDDGERTLAGIVFKVCREPNNLLAHLRRIYFCYQSQRAEQLYAALLDLFIVLQGRGQAFSRRVLEGSRSLLPKHEFLSLTQAVNGDSTWPGNRYSVFSSGTVGRKDLVEHIRQDAGQVDVLVLANDFIEYSQLDQAMEVLELGVRAEPARLDIQQALLELYKSAGEHARFQSVYDAFTQAGMPLTDEWLEAAAYFAGRS